jgi:hypothetical protein
MTIKKVVKKTAKKAAPKKQKPAKLILAAQFAIGEVVSVNGDLGNIVAIKFTASKVLYTMYSHYGELRNDIPSEYVEAA